MLNLVRTSPEETAQLVGLAAVHDQAVAGRLAGKTVLTPDAGTACPEGCGAAFRARWLGGWRPVRPR